MKKILFLTVFIIALFMLPASSHAGFNLIFAYTSPAVYVTYDPFWVFECNYFWDACDIVCIYDFWEPWPWYRHRWVRTYYNPYSHYRYVYYDYPHYGCERVYIHGRYRYRHAEPYYHNAHYANIVPQTRTMRRERVDEYRREIPEKRTKSSQNYYAYSQQRSVPNVDNDEDRFYTANKKQKTSSANAEKNRELISKSPTTIQNKSNATSISSSIRKNSDAIVKTKDVQPISRLSDKSDKNEMITTKNSISIQNKTDKEKITAAKITDDGKSLPTTVKTDKITTKNNSLSKYNDYYSRPTPQTSETITKNEPSINTIPKTETSSKFSTPSTSYSEYYSRPEKTYSITAPTAKDNTILPSVSSSKNRESSTYTTPKISKSENTTKQSVIEKPAPLTIINKNSSKTITNRESKYITEDDEKESKSKSTPKSNDRTLSNPTTPRSSSPSFQNNSSKNTSSSSTPARSVGANNSKSGSNINKRSMR